jgi:hypothetical protein
LSVAHDFGAQPVPAASAGGDVVDASAPPRPRTWGECKERGLGTPERPCPYAGCKYNLALEVSPRTGRLVLNPLGEVDALPETCALRAAEAGGMTYDQIARRLGVTKQAVRHIELTALDRLGVKPRVRRLRGEIDRETSRPDLHGVGWEDEPAGPPLPRAPIVRIDAPPPAPPAPEPTAEMPPARVEDVVSEKKPKCVREGCDRPATRDRADTAPRRRGMCEQCKHADRQREIREARDDSPPSAKSAPTRTKEPAPAVAPPAPSVVPAPREAQIVATCQGLAELLCAKNRAYGDSALSPVRVFSKASPLEQLLVRMDDKISRLARGEALPDENLRDTVRDLAGYCVLYLIADAERGA